MTPSEFAALPWEGKINTVRAWWLANAQEGYTSATGARACAECYGAPLNTIRGLQRLAFVGDVPPWRWSLTGWSDTGELSKDEQAALADSQSWCDCCGGIAHKVEGQCIECGSSNDAEPEAEEPELPRDRAADAAAGRAAARQPRPPKHKKRYTIDDDGLFQPARPGEPLHICPACKRTAADHAELSLGWGLRTDKRSGRVSPQSRCYRCRTAHRQQLRELRKLQLDIVPTPATEQAASAMRQGEADEIARRAAAALRNGSAVVELEVKDDPRVALALDVEVVSAGLYPLCPGGPLGAIVGCDPESDTGILRLRFDARALRDWAISQGAQLLTAAPTTEQAHAAYQNPPGLNNLLGGRL